MKRAGAHISISNTILICLSISNISLQDNVVNRFGMILC